MHRPKAAPPPRFVTRVANRGNLICRPKTKADQERELRNKLYLEIESKSKACSNRSFACSIPRLEGYSYCIRHILQDPRAPYKQCAFIYYNGKKCNLAAPKHDTRKFPGLTTFCFKHSRLLQLTKTRNSVGKFKKVETTEGLLKTLTCHINVDKKKICTNTSYEDYMEEEIDVVSSNTKLFVNYTNIHDLETISLPNKNAKGILDYASDSSDDGKTKMRVSTEGCEFDNSDNESIDSDNEDLLKHAGIYTAQETITISKDKLVRLQQLYYGQIDRLKHLLREKRRKYLHALRKEKETCCSIHEQKKITQADRVQYEKLKALNHYHKWNGNEAILYRKFKEKKAKASGTHKPQIFPKCIFTEGGVKCGEVAIPSCKYCRKHVLEDKKQILFRACNIEKSGIVCQEPIANIFDDSTCVWHVNIPSLRTYSQKKYESESDEDVEEKTNAPNKSQKINSKTESNNKQNQIKLKKEPTATITSNTKGTHIVKDFNHQNITICHDPIEDDIEILAEFRVSMDQSDYEKSIIDPIEEQIAAICGSNGRNQKQFVNVLT